jgi:response regulator RpfG family c-di-GMP phosphodiesterase
MNARVLPRILCVDDEPRVLDGLALTLRRDFEVHIAQSGQEALRKLAELGNFAVLVSDMRMPGMSGATLLHQVMRSHPEITRILLTGEPGRDAAASAVNDGQIFRFLTKPCAPDSLKKAIEDAVGQHRLMIAERQLLQETLVGSIKALIDVLAITNPVAFGRANRVKRLAVELASDLGAHKFWQLDAAAMLSQLGYISLPVELVEKLYYGERLTPEEQTLAQGIPDVAQKLLGHIPRLEPVLQILTLANRVQTIGAGDEGSMALGGRILRVVLEFDSLIAQGQSIDDAMQALRSRGEFRQAHLDALAKRVGARAGASEVREIPLRLVKPGMTLMQDLRTHLGTLLVPRGFEVSEAFLHRLQGFGAEILSEKVRVMIVGANDAKDASKRLSA